MRASGRVSVACPTLFHRLGGGGFGPLRPVRLTALHYENERGSLEQTTFRTAIDRECGIYLDSPRSTTSSRSTVVRLLRGQRRRNKWIGWWAPLVLTILAAHTCPAFDLLDFGPNDLDPNDWSATALVGLPPEVLIPRLVDGLSVTTLRPAAFTLSFRYASCLAVVSCSMLRSDGKDFPTRQSRIVRQIRHAHSHSTATSSEAATDPA
jgi:hypothetical protein